MKLRKFRLQKVLPDIEHSLDTLDEEEGKVQDQAEEPVPTQEDEAEEDEPPIPLIPIDEAIDHYHKHIPSASLKTWHENLRSFAKHITRADMVPFGTACTGTDIFAKVMEKLFLYWRLTFGLSIGHLHAVLHSEQNPKKQHFLCCEFDVQLMVPDCEMFHDRKVYNTVTGDDELLPETSLYGAGFCCTDISKMNSQRKRNANNVRDKTGKTGTTLEASLTYIETQRPPLAILECVPEMENIHEDDDGSKADSDSDKVVARLEAKQFTVLVVRFRCSRYGSRAERDRWYAAVIDAEPTRWKPRITTNFNDVFASITMPMMPIDRFLLTEVEMLEWCDDGKYVKRGRASRILAEPDWTVDHEQLYLLHKLQWPPTDPEYKTIFDNFGREREAELVHLANNIFPETTVGHTMFFDCNHAASRVLKPDDQTSSEDKQVKLKLRNPWREHVPTLTCQSSIAMRTLIEGGEGGACTITRLHGLEVMQLIGWDKSMYRASRPPWQHATPELLADMAGNAWSGFAIAPLMTALAGAVPWHEIEGVL